MDTISDNLKQNFQSFIERTNAYDFFIGLADYTNYILETPMLKKIVDEIMKEKNIEHKKLTYLEEKSLEELREAKKKLLTIIADNNINTTSLEGKRSMSSGICDGLLNEIEQFEKGEISISGFHGDNLEMYLFDIAVGIAEQGYKNLVQEFIDQNRRPQNIRGNFVFSKTLHLYHAQIELMNRAIKLELWGAFDNLLRFQKAYSEECKNIHYAKVLSKYGSQSKNYLESRDAVDITFATQDLRKIVDSRYSRVLDNDLHHLKITNFRTYATRANNYLTKKISEQSKQKIRSSTTTHNEKARQIYKIQIVERKFNSGKIKIIVNEDYQSPLEVSRKKYWSILYDIAENNKPVTNNKAVLDYFNSHSKNPLYTSRGYKRTKILKSDGAACIVPNIIIELITEKKFAQRRNKTA